VGAAGTPAALDCSTPTAPVLHAQLLTPSQYDHSVLDLLQVTGTPSKGFNNGVDAQLDDLGVELRANAAATVAKQAASTLAAWSPCAKPGATDAACEMVLVQKLGARAYRHPLSQAELAELTTLFDAGIKEKDFATGLEWFLTGLLQSPDFLYQLARPQPGELAGAVLPQSSYELASRLSYFVWDSPPDEALYLAAASGALGDAAMLPKEVARLMQDARSARGVAAFYSSWLKLSGFGEVARDAPGFTTAVVSSLERSLLASAAQLYASDAPNIASLFSGQSYWLDGPLRAFYGLPGDHAASDLTLTDMPNEGRSGILTHPALMALLARPGETNPISRGLFVRRTVLCQDLPPPPANLTIPQLPPVSPNASTRERLDRHASAALCAACHDVIDPPGFALESFDQVGRLRTMDGGKPVDTSGTMTAAGDLAGAFASGGELLGRFSQSHDVRACFARKYFEFAAERSVGPEDGCAIDTIAKTFTTTGDLKGLVAAIATSPAFRLRRSEGGPP
jgi:Protein of unknown function (DUF1588)/Protein of unknown function (DUF1592)/Protein of unknown function (DUF1595)/Protein of unknown function (DUF1585)